MDEPEAEEKNFRYAGFRIRVWAAVIDGILLLLCIKLLTYRLLAGLEPVPFLLFQMIFHYLYFAGLESSKFKATPGKKIAGIMVVNEQGNQLSFLQATGRYFSKVLSGLLLFAGYIMVAFTRRKQGLHDLFAGTIVVRDNWRY